MLLNEEKTLWLAHFIQDIFLVLAHIQIKEKTRNPNTALSQCESLVPSVANMP